MHFCKITRMKTQVDKAFAQNMDSGDYAADDTFRLYHGATDFQATNMAHIRQSRPDSGLGFQAKVLETFSAVPSSLGSRMAASASLTALPISRHVPHTEHGTYEAVKTPVKQSRPCVRQPRPDYGLGFQARVV